MVARNDRAKPNGQPGLASASWGSSVQSRSGCSFGNATHVDVVEAQPVGVSACRLTEHCTPSTRLGAPVCGGGNHPPFNGGTDHRPALFFHHAVASRIGRGVRWVELRRGGLTVTDAAVPSCAAKPPYQGTGKFQPPSSLPNPPTFCPNHAASSRIGRVRCLMATRHLLTGRRDSAGKDPNPNIVSTIPSPRNGKHTPDSRKSQGGI